MGSCCWTGPARLARLPALLAGPPCLRSSVAGRAGRARGGAGWAREAGREAGRDPGGLLLFTGREERWVGGGIAWS